VNTGPVRRRDGDLCLAVHVQPGAARNEVAGRYGDRIKLRLTAAAVAGRANTALIAFMAGEFGVPKMSVNITAGHTSRRKTVIIHEPRQKPEWLSEADQG